MAQIICPNCNNTFDSNNPESIAARSAVAVATGLVGAEVCGSMGILLAPGVGISGVVPGAVGGAFIGWFTADQFRRCPACKKIFKT